MVSRSVGKCFSFILWILILVYTWYQSEYQSKEIKRESKSYKPPHRVTHNSLHVIPSFISLRGGFWVKQMIQIPAQFLVIDLRLSTLLICDGRQPISKTDSPQSTECRRQKQEESAVKCLIFLKETPQPGSKSSEINTTFTFITMSHNQAVKSEVHNRTIWGKWARGFLGNGSVPTYE